MSPLTTKSILEETKKTLRVGMPIVAAQLLQMSMGTVDTLMAGRLSTQDLAAVAVGGSLLAPLMLFCMGVLMSVNPVVAHLHGAGKKSEIGRNVWSALWLSQFLALPCVFILRNMTYLMELFAIDPEIIPLTQGYLHAYSFGVPAALAYWGLRFFHEGLAVTKPAMYFAIVGLLFNVFGNWTFMYGHLGFPAMGAVGTGWATTVVQWVMLTCVVVFTFRPKVDNEYNIIKGFHLPNLKHQRELMRIGFPNGSSIGIEVSMFATVALIMGSLGTKVVAAHQITITFASITFMIPLGLSFATTARVGFATGQAKIGQVRLIGWVGLALSFLIMSLMACFMINWPQLIAGVFTADLVVQNLAASLLFVAGLFQISDGLQVAGFGALRGLKDTKIPMLVNIVSYWGVGLPLGYYLGISLDFGGEGLWIGLTAGLTVAAILHNWRFYLLSKVSI